MKKVLSLMILAVLIGFGSSQNSAAQVVAVDSVTNITTTSLTVYGSYYSFVNGGSTHFEIATDAAYSQNVQNSTDVPNSDTMGTNSYTFSGLTPNTVYHVRMVGIVSNVTFYGFEVVDTTLQNYFLPAFTLDSLHVTSNSVTAYYHGGTLATGNDTMNSNSTVATNPTFTQNVTTLPQPQFVQNGTLSFSVFLGGLIPSTNYYWKGVNANRVGPQNLPIHQFTTLSANPSASADSASTTDTTATLHGSGMQVDSCWFIYGPNFNNIDVLHTGTNTPIVVGNGNNFVSSAVITLNPSTIFYWEFVVKHDGVLYYSSTMTDTTRSVVNPFASLSVSGVPTVNSVDVSLALDTYNQFAEVGIMYGQPSWNSGSVSSTQTGIFNATLPAITLNGLLPATGGQARAFIVIASDTSWSNTVNFVTDQDTAIPFAGQITNAHLTSSTTATVNFEFTGWPLCTVWVDASLDTTFLHPLSNTGTPLSIESQTTAYSSYDLSNLPTGHIIYLRLAGYNSANTSVFYWQYWTFSTITGIEEISQEVSNVIKAYQVYNMFGQKMIGENYPGKEAVKEKMNSLPPGFYSMRMNTTIGCNIEFKFVR